MCGPHSLCVDELCQFTCNIECPRISDTIEHTKALTRLRCASIAPHHNGYYNNHSFAFHTAYQEITGSSRRHFRPATAL